MVAINSLGGKETKEVIVNCNPIAPQLEVFNIGTVEGSNIKIRGTINDVSDKYPSVTINGKTIEYKYNAFEYEVQLKREKINLQ